MGDVITIEPRIQIKGVIRVHERRIQIESTVLDSIQIQERPIPIQERTIKIEEGGPGSGYAGHPGRPGQVGGSVGGGRASWGDVIPGHLRRTHITVGRRMARLDPGQGKAWFQVVDSQTGKKVWRVFDLSNKPQAPGGHLYQMRKGGKEFFLWNPKQGAGRAPGAAAPRAGRGKWGVGIVLPVPADPKPYAAPNANADEQRLFQSEIVFADRTKDAGFIKGFSESYRVKFADGQQAVYKPASGAEPIQKYAVQAEVGAYKVAQIVGDTDIMPTTVSRDLPKMFDNQTSKGPGSLQAFVTPIPPYGTARDVGYRAKDLDTWQLARAAVFDAAVRNTDRHDNNWMTDGSGHIRLIDHNFAFDFIGHGEIKGMWASEFPRKFRSPFPQMMQSREAAGGPRIPTVSDTIRPYVDHMPELRDTLKQIGMSDDNVDRFSNRVRDISTYKSWDELYRKTDLRNNPLGGGPRS